MKKTFKLIDLDCANCAAKMETAVKKIPGVKDATVSFMAQKMTIEAEDDQFDQVVKEAVAACKKVEPDCEVVVK
ncbi:MAG: cation transporter [Bacteroidales bacterium]|nr:cation transporter [Fournierella massiliensis]MCF2558083.1 cation transporter [Fournierella massiliensis]MCI6739789.1 cation transporter [Bacteroidales bacterium]